jgi:hypothetical protein
MYSHKGTTMLRFMTPYLAVALAIAMIGGAGYGSGAVSAPVTYLTVFIATLIACAGYVRWDQHHHPSH